MNHRAKILKPTWVNEVTASRGYLELDGKQYPVGKTYPFDDPAERNVIGCILAAGEAGNGVRAMRSVGFLRYDDFFAVRHGIIYRAMEHIFMRGDEIDTATVAAELFKVAHTTGTQLDRVGGEAYLLTLANVQVVNIETYARQVVRASLRRAVKVASHLSSSLAENESLELDELIKRVHRLQQDVAVRAYSLSNTDTHNLYDMVDTYMAKVESEIANDSFVPGLPTGFQLFDEILSGWRKNLLYIFAAPPGWGKTALLLCIALNALMRGQRVLFISLEMPVEEMMDRMICIHAGIDSTRYRNRRGLTPMELSRIRSAAATLKGATQSKSFIMSRLRTPTMSEIETKIQEFYYDPGYDLIILDYAAPNKISDPRYDGDDHKLMGHIYKELERMKEHYNVPFITATQMNQKWDTRSGKRPGETDLYHGSVGRFAADVIAFIYHPSKAFTKDETVDPHLTEIIFRKNRSGKSGNKAKMYLYWEEEMTRFSDAKNNTAVDLPEDEW